VTPERWTQIEELFHRAAECAPENRTALLTEACGDDPELRREVEALLSCDRDAAGSVQAAVIGGLETVGFPLTGETISHYHILDGLGGGGMGLVYRAEDIKLGRRVALKFLPEESVKDPAALGRFEREARSASALEHPNICPIYEFGEHEGQPFLVMQLLEGQTLRELIATAGPAKPPLELGKLLDLAVQIVDGLDAAHQKGIIHRDIKPANIFVTREGQAKILDFGLAKLASMLSAESDDSESAARGAAHIGSTPHQTLPLSTPDLFLSRTGVAMGTAGYMSPEQVRGEKLDARSDLFSFGLVLYEMATGKRAFAGDTGPDLQKAILTQIPSPARGVNPNLPPMLEKLLRRALEKDRDARYQSAAEMRADLQNLQGGIQPKPRARWRESAAAGIAILLVVVGAFWFARHQSAAEIHPPEWKLRQLTSNPPENSVTSGAISPDGKYLSYTDTKGIHIKLVETGETHTVPHPEELKGKNVEWGIIPQWFPDNTRFLADAHPTGESPAFASSLGSSIWIISVAGGPPHKLRDNATAYSISPDGSTIAFGTNKGRRGDREIWLMDADGENARKLYEIDENGSICCLHWFPHGERVWYGTTDKIPGGIVTRDLRGGPVIPIFPASATRTSWQYLLLPDSRLLYPLSESGAVGQTCNYWVMPLNERTGTPTDKPKRLTNWGGFCPLGTSVTADGRKLAFLKWVGHTYVHLADIAADGKHIVDPRQFAASEGQDNLLDWTADGKEIIFASNRNGHVEIFKQPVDGDNAQLLVTGPYDGVDARVSPDGASLLYIAQTYEDGSGPMQIMRMPLVGGTSQLVLTASPFSEFRCGRSPSSVCVISERTEDRRQMVLTAFDSLGGRGAEIARIDLDSEAKKFHWDLSQDGTRIAYFKTPQMPIEILSLNGEAPRSLFVKGWNNLDSLDWTADGEGFFVSDGLHGGMVLLRVDLQGNAKVLQNFEGGGSLSAGPSPDGKHLGIREFRIEGNIWTLETF
jgi:serine/threonine protein kinase/dipeptidyl aminopeptidase/acylaminoacyl peptidase